MAPLQWINHGMTRLVYLRLTFFKLKPITRKQIRPQLTRIYRMNNNTHQTSIKNREGSGALWQSTR